MCWSDRNLSGSKPETFAAIASCEICRTRVAGNLFRLIQWVTAAGVMPRDSDNFLFPPSIEITSKIFTALPQTKLLNSCRIGITKCKEFYEKFSEKFTFDNSNISEFVMTKGGLPPWKKAVISMPKYKIAMGKTPSELRRWQNANHNRFTQRTILSFIFEKRNVLYLKRERTVCWASRALQRMLALSTISTPSVASCGATTVWANGPIAPPSNKTLFSQSTPLPNLKFGTPELKPYRILKVTYVEQTSTKRITTCKGNEAIRISR